jgi:hypothetical protein
VGEQPGGSPRSRFNDVAQKNARSTCKPQPANRKKSPQHTRQTLNPLSTLCFEQALTHTKQTNHPTGLQPPELSLQQQAQPRDNTAPQQHASCCLARRSRLFLGASISPALPPASQRLPSFHRHIGGAWGLGLWALGQGQPALLGAGAQSQRKPRARSSSWWSDQRRVWRATERCAARARSCMPLPLCLPSPEQQSSWHTASPACPVCAPRAVLTTPPQPRHRAECAYAPLGAASSS